MLSRRLRYRVVVLKTAKEPQTEEVASSSIVSGVWGAHCVELVGTLLWQTCVL
jgi:hypothetical protein